MPSFAFINYSQLIKGSDMACCRRVFKSTMYSTLNVLRRFFLLKMLCDVYDIHIHSTKFLIGHLLNSLFLIKC